MEELNYEELRRIQTKEKGPLLSHIPDEFYELAANMVRRYSAETPGDLREKDNVFKILKYIHNRRIEKILMAALNASNGVEPPPEMMKSEREFFSQLLVLLKEEEKTLGDAGGGVTRALSHAATMAKGNDEIGKKIGKDEEIKPITKTEETKGSEERRTEKEISVIQDIEEFVGLNGHTYGPYKSGEHVTVPAEEAEMLIKMKAAKQME